MRVVFFTLIGIFMFYKIINIIEKNDIDSGINLKRERKLEFLIFFSTTLLYLKYGRSIEFLVYHYLFIYLFITAYIDYKSQNVYSILNYLTIVIGIFYLIYQRKIGVDIKITIICVVICVIINLILYKRRSYANGDSEIYIALSIFIASLVSNIVSLLIIFILNIIVAEIVNLIFNVKLVDWKRFRFKEPIAFAPSIAFSTILFILIS